MGRKRRSLVYYADLDELRLLIMGGKPWKNYFSKIFDHIPLQAAFYYLEPYRHISHHGGNVSDSELLRVIVEARYLFERIERFI